MKKKGLCLIIVLEIFCIIFAAVNIFSKELICQTYEDGAVPVGENKIDLGRGSYQVFIEYETDNYGIYSQFRGKSIVGEELEDKAWFRPEQTVKKFELRIDRKMCGSFLLLQGGDKNAEELIKVHKITILETRGQGRMELFLLCSLFLLVDITYILYCKQIWKKLPNEKKWSFLSFAVISILSSVPLFLSYLLEGNDTAFHVRRIEELAQGMLAGQFPVRMEAGYLNDMGYPISIMYGDLLLYIPAFLRIMGFRAHTALQIYLFLINVVTAVSAYKCIFVFTEKRIASLAGCAVYVMSAYRISDVYYRGAVGETTAMAFTPLIFAGLYGMFHKGETYRKQSAVYMIIGYTGVLQSHILSFEMVIIFSALYLCLNLKEFWGNFAVFMKTAIVTVLLNLSYLIPFLDYMLTHEFMAASVETDMQAHGLFFSQLFLTQAIGNISYPVGNGMGVDMPLGLGYALVLVLLLWLAQMFVWGVSKNQWKMFAMTVVSLVMTSYLFPWGKISQFPVVGRYLTMFQFPWRFMMPATLFCSILSGYAFCNFEVREKRSLGIGVVLLLVSISLFNGEQWMDRAMTSMGMLKITSAYALDPIASVAGGEYLLTDVVQEDFTKREAIGEEGVVISSCKKDGISVEFACRNTGKEKKTVRVPLLAYKGFVAVDEETGAYLERGKDKSALLEVILPGNYQGVVHVSFKEPVLWRIAEGISLVMLIILIFCLQKERDLQKILLKIRKKA